jgi:hypothetical protein
MRPNLTDQISTYGNLAEGNVEVLEEIPHHPPRIPTTKPVLALTAGVGPAGGGGPSNARVPATSPPPKEGSSYTARAPAPTPNPCEASASTAGAPTPAPAPHAASVSTAPAPAPAPAPQEASVSTARARFGAAINRLEITTSNIQTARLNVSAANSRIRDVDIADETASLSKNQVLTQAATSVLSQANSSPQSALSLIR